MELNYNTTILKKSGRIKLPNLYVGYKLTKYLTITEKHIKDFVNHYNNSAQYSSLIYADKKRQLYNIGIVFQLTYVKKTNTVYAKYAQIPIEHRYRELEITAVYMINIKMNNKKPKTSLRLDHVVVFDNILPKGFKEKLIKHKKCIDRNIRLQKNNYNLQNKESANS